MMKRPLLTFTVCWTLGSSAACLYSGTELLLTVAGLSLLLAVPLFIGRITKGFTVIMLFSLIVSSAYWEWNDARNQSGFQQAAGISATGEAAAAGTIVSAVQVDGDRAQFEMAVRSLQSTEVPEEKIVVQIKLAHPQEAEEARTWKRGDLVNLEGNLEPPGSARNFGGFDYREHLRSKQIHWIMKIKGTGQVQIKAPESWSFKHILRWNDGLRLHLGKRIDRLFGAFHGGYMKGLIIGDQRDLDPETFAEFSRLGLTHVLAISGMHVAVFAGGLLFVFSAFRMTREASLTTVILLLPLYVLLTGASPSVIRAGMMGMIGLYAARKRLLKDGKNILCAAALGMLVYNPYYLVSVSFQLSFLVTAGLMIFVPKLTPLLGLLPRWLAGSVSVGVTAQLVSFPMTIYYFNSFSLLSLPANLLLVPLISLVVLPAGTVAVIIGLVWPGLAEWVAAAVKWMNSFTFLIVEWMNGSPVWMTIWPSPRLWWIAAYFAVLYSLLHTAGKQREAHSWHVMPDETAPLDNRVRAPVAADAGWVQPSWNENLGWLYAASMSRYTVVRKVAHWAEKRRLSLTLPLLILLSGLLLSAYMGPLRHGAGLVRFLDVGQGDAMLATTPGGKHILIDGGGTTNFRREKDAWKERHRPFETGAQIVVPLLKKQGVHSLDMVMISHNHQDHTGGLQAVLESIPVKSILFNGSLAESQEFEKLLRTAVDRGIPIYKAEAGMVIRPDAATSLEFLYPDIKADNKEGELPVIKDQNHHSLVVRMEMNGAGFLFTGDADAAAERDILDGLRQLSRSGEFAGSFMRNGADLPVIDVLKVGHHGSKTSTTAAWLEGWKPKAAFISAGVNNLYRHPHPDVVARLQRHQVLLFRSDLHGETQIRVSPAGKLEVRTRLLEGRAE